MKRFAFILGFLIANISVALAQSNIQVIGPITLGDCPQFSSPTIVKDAGFGCTGALTFPATSKFYQSTGANIIRLNDRVFIAGATVNSGNLTIPNLDWWAVLTNANSLGYDGNYAQTLILYDINNPNATLAVPQVALAAVTANQNAPTGATPRGIEFFAYNANPSASSHASVWGLYGEAHNLSANSQQTFGFELEVRAGVAAPVTWNPFSTTAPASVVGQAIGCGAGVGVSNNCTVAEYIAPNPQLFGSGILFINGSILATGGLSPAMQMPFNYDIEWWENSSTRAGYITATNTGQVQIVSASNSIATTGAIVPQATPGTAVSMSCTVSTVVVANGGNSTPLASITGMLTLMDKTSSAAAIYLLQGGGVTAVSLGAGGKWVAPTTTPGAGTESVNFDGTAATRIYNNTGASVTYSVCQLGL